MMDKETKKSETDEREAYGLKDNTEVMPAEEIKSLEIDLAKGKKQIGYAAVIQIAYLLLTDLYFLITTSKFSINNTVVLAIAIVLYMLIYFKRNKIAGVIVGILNGIVCIVDFCVVCRMISFLFSPVSSWFGGYMLELIFSALIQLVICGGIIVLYAKSENVRQYIMGSRK
jgi:hypothetical protein